MSKISRLATLILLAIAVASTWAADLRSCCAPEPPLTPMVDVAPCLSAPCCLEPAARVVRTDASVSIVGRTPATVSAAGTAAPAVAPVGSSSPLPATAVGPGPAPRLLASVVLRC